MLNKPETSAGLSILIVEDEALIAEEIQDRLTRLGFYAVGIRDTGEAAIQAAEQLHPDLVLMDIRLKGKLDGIAAADRITQQLHVPVVYLTAHSDDSTLQRAKETAPFGYLLKPFQERDLLVAIEMAIHRYELEKRLKESEQRYVATLMSIGDGVIATDAVGRVTFMNAVAEGITQWRIDDARGLPIDQVLPMVTEAARVSLENLAMQALRLNRTVTLTEPVVTVTRSGESIPIDDSAAPIAGAHGKVVGAVVAFRDIRQQRLAEDALKQAEDQLRQSQRMEAIGRLAGGIAHDFNNLLTVIIGCSELLLSGRHVDDTSRQFIVEIKNAGERAADLTRQLLAFGRKQILQPVTLNLERLVGNMSRMLQRIIGEDVILTTKGVADLWSIHADPGQLEQLIMNLAANARDAMPQGGRMTIECRNVYLTERLIQSRPEMQPGRYVLMAVSDTGVGMDHATQEHAFEPFFTTKEVGKGTGLGLASVYGIVKQSHGFIYLYSEVGKGTTFKLYFPSETAEVQATLPTESADTTQGTETILLVEDDDAVRSLAASGLRSRGFRVEEARNGEEAFHWFAEHPADVHLVVTDVIMPNLSGREFGERVRALRPSIRVLFMSGYTDDTIIRHGISTGEANFLQKPYTLHALAQKVREVLDR
jgi:two-component system cell cycle sensor histidine kinase/response regulator CckA